MFSCAHLWEELPELDTEVIVLDTNYLMCFGLTEPKESPQGKSQTPNSTVSLLLTSADIAGDI